MENNRKCSICECEEIGQGRLAGFVTPGVTGDYPCLIPKENNVAELFLDLFFMTAPFKYRGIKTIREKNSHNTVFSIFDEL
ncbi:hypothetical protein [Clostridium estertheticum]|uniref:hypothetical protein n=1 Tax=Clostridium estertheticum TaxID=238834 RepID=UPI001C6EDE7E|nr:hypothetical protein [Clostridium estertheticum]MBW9153868.1 hypothetical protein [Clostridium estertheticum]WLC86486.1 hypothetical protein KTC97_20325 [Clostridium estertheticum]